MVSGDNILFHFFVGFGFGIGKKLVSKKVSDSVLKIFSIGKVSDSVSEEFGIGKKFRIRFRSDFGYRHTLITSRSKILNCWSAKQSQKMH